MLFSLKNKTALVTGCSKGIGKAIAIGLAEAGADIIGVSSSLSMNDDVGQEVMALGRSFKAYRADFSDRNSVYAFLEKVIAENTNIDILVNNAGIILREPAVSHSDEYWDKALIISILVKKIFFNIFIFCLLKYKNAPNSLKSP